MLHTKLSKAHFSGMDFQSLQPPKATKQVNTFLQMQNVSLEKKAFF